LIAAATPVPFVVAMVAAAEAEILSTVAKLVAILTEATGANRAGGLPIGHSMRINKSIRNS
jgi:hypothetical protein